MLLSVLGSIIRISFTGEAIPLCGQGSVATNRMIHRLHIRALHERKGVSVQDRITEAVGTYRGFPDIVKSCSSCERCSSLGHSVALAPAFDRFSIHIRRHKEADSQHRLGELLGPINGEVFWRRGTSVREALEVRKFVPAM